MFIDARTLEVDQTVSVEVCIVGAGPAGIALAKELVDSSRKVCLLESGGLTPDSSIQALNESMDAIGDQIYPCPDFPGAATMRTRQFGGTSHQWDRLVRYVPLEEIDFEKRDWLPHSGWPFKKSDLNPYYARAQEVCGLGGQSYEAKDWESIDSPQISFDSEVLTNRIFQFGPLDIFSQRYQALLRASTNIDTYLYSSVYELEVDDTAQQVQRAKVITPKGHYWVRANRFILATGAIENARILLLSNQVQTQGLGNQNNLVGRFLMDHPMVRVGILHPPSRKTIGQMKLYGMQRSQDNPEVEYQCKPIISAAAVQREQLLGANAYLLPFHSWAKFDLIRFLLPRGKNYVSPAVSSAISFSRNLRRGKIDGELLLHFKTTIGGLDDLLHFQGRKNRTFDHECRWPQEPQRQKHLGVFHVYSLTEQAPRPDNRVTLGSEKDAFGYPKVQLVWRWDEFSRRSVVKAEKLFQAEFARAGLGRLALEMDKGEPQVNTLSCHHTMGTTRMHHDPKQGVVDANCQVHGMHNLFIAGASTFPTGGYANPTLTIVALAIRLADHIKSSYS